MSSNRNLVLRSVVQASCLFILATIASHSSAIGTEINDIKYLGTVQGKSYFVERTQNRNWTQAKEYCIAAGMRLASINTPEQTKLLEDTFDTSQSGTAHWTAARLRQDYLTHSNFEWYYNQQSPNAAAVPQLDMFYGIRGSDACLIFHPKKGAHSLTRYFASLCDFGQYSGTKVSTLCEVEFGKTNENAKLKENIVKTKE